MKIYKYGALALAALSLAATAKAQSAEPKAYQYVVTDKEGNSTVYAADDVDVIRFDEAPEYSALPVVHLLGYEEKDDAGYYHLELATGQCDDYGDPLEVGKMLVSVTMRGPKSEDLTKPVLPVGYYKAGNGKEDMTFDVNSSGLWVRWEEGEDGVNPSIILDGTVDVRAAGEDNYDIRFELITNDGSVDLRYEGPLAFPRGYSDFEAFTEDVNITFTNADGRFYGTWAYPFSADLFTRFWAGTVQNGEMVNGYILNVDFNEPKPEDCMAAVQRVADGTYTVEKREEIMAYTYLPYRFNGGKWLELWGQKYIVNTYITYVDETGRRKLGLITDGSFTVSENGTKFEFDFVTEEGIAIKGSYAKAPTITNYCDNDVKEPKRPYSTLQQDLEIEWPENVVAVAYNCGNTILDDANEIVLYITDNQLGTKGDYLQLDIIAKGETLENGTYQVGAMPTDKGIINGCLDYGGEPIFSWYSNLDETDNDGYLTKLAPLYGGSVTISGDDEDSKKIEIDVTDDNGNQIVGEFTGKINYYTAESQASVVRKLAPAKGGLKTNAGIDRLRMRGKK